MENSVKYDLGRKYAVAFVTVFTDQLNDAVGTIANALDLLRMKQLRFFENSICLLQKEDQRQFITKFLEYLHLPNCFFSLVRLLVKHGRIQLFTLVLQMIATILCKKNNLQEVFIYSTQPLSCEDQEKIKNFMFFLRKKIISRIVCIVRPELIAGIRIESDGFVWEYSVCKQLAAINAILFQEGINYE